MIFLPIEKQSNLITPADIVLNSSYNQVGVLMSDIIPRSSLNYKGATLMSDEYQD